MNFTSQQTPGNERESAPTVKKKPSLSLRGIRTVLSQKKFWYVFIIVVVALSLLGGMYMLGYSNGRNRAEERAKTTRNALDVWRNGNNPFANTITGKLHEIRNGSIVVDTNRGERKEVMLGNDTKITRKTESLRKDDLKTDMKVTVFVSSKDHPTATRIVVTQD